MLYQLLLEHPEVRLARGTKETNYFTREYDRGIEWYKAFFAHCAEARATGEISNNYFYVEEAPKRIYLVLPQVKLFCCLRNPFDRLRSVYLYRRRSGEIPCDMPLENAVFCYPDLVTDNCYYRHLERYYSYFEREQILILLYDDLVKCPEVFIRKLFEFLGVNSEFSSPVVYKRINAGSAPRSRWIGYVAANTSESLRRLGLLRVLDRLKRSDVARQAILRPVIVDSNNPSLHLRRPVIDRLQEAWEPQIAAIERLVGRSLRHWLAPGR